jgi:hypothetical protein
MTAIQWSVVEAASQLLEPDERETVLGDLVEGGESAWHALVDVLGLILRRQVGLWTSWRPWIAAFGLALPCSFPLMGFSVSISWMVLHHPNAMLDPKTGVNLGLALLCQVLLLIACAWTGGLVLGSLSRRTLWVSIVAVCSPCLFCLSRFRIESLSPLCLLLFLPPAILGVRQGMRKIRIDLVPAALLAAATTLLMAFTWSRGVIWFLNWALIWPAWYLVATAQKSREKTQTAPEETAA